MFDNCLQTYNAAVYLRLSKEDEEAGQSESIGNQRDFIMRCVLEQGWNIAGQYIDDGFSGLNFDRPAFRRMIADIESKKVNLVITKDLSRLGRDYIDTGYYLERYFPRKNVRYIALNDGIDTFAANGGNDMSPFKAVINDMYAKDISKKIRAVMDTKRRNGQFIGAFAPYGYAKDPADRNSFVVDEEAAAVVRRIFESYIGGVGICGIARMLNNEGVPCPAKYKLATGNYKNAMLKKYRWTQETVKRILTNPSYMGSMAQRRQEKISYKLDKFRKIEPKNWIVVQNTHVPIVSPDDYRLVQELIQSRAVRYARPEGAPHLLNGLLFCRDCGAKMTYRRNKSGKMVAQCMTYTKYGPSLCGSHRMNEQAITDRVTGELRKIAAYALDEDYFGRLSLEPTEAERDKSDDGRLARISRKLAENKEIIKGLYLDKLKGVIDEEMFLAMSGEFGAEKERLNREYAELADKKSGGPGGRNDADYMSVIRQIANFEIVDKLILFRLIERAEITSDRRIVIKYKFRNPFTADIPT